MAALASLLVGLVKIQSCRPAGSVEHRQGSVTRGTSPQTEHPTEPPRSRYKKKTPALRPTLHRAIGAQPSSYRLPGPVPVQSSTASGTRSRVRLTSLGKGRSGTLSDKVWRRSGGQTNHRPWPKSLNQKCAKFIVKIVSPPAQHPTGHNYAGTPEPPPPSLRSPLLNRFLFARRFFFFLPLLALYFIGPRWRSFFLLRRSPGGLFLVLHLCQVAFATIEHSQWFRFFFHGSGFLHDVQ